MNDTTNDLTPTGDLAPAGAAADSSTGHDGDSDPFPRIAAWMEDARKSEPNDPDAACLATSTADGFPSARMVLVRAIDERGFVFYTNLESNKGRQLHDNPRAALCFHWKSLRRSLRVEGDIVPVSDSEADAYFASRARDSRIGAWASKQSRPMKGRFELEGRVALHVAKFGLGPVPRPPFWSGFRLVPQRIEFWQDRPFRLHDRLVYLRQPDEAASSAASPPAIRWQTERLYP